MSEFEEGSIVYNVQNVPLKFGAGGPKVGVCSVVMDSFGNFAIEGIVNDMEVLPQIQLVNIPEFSVYVQSDDTPVEQDEEETEPLMEAFWFETTDEKPFSDVEETITPEEEETPPFPMLFEDESEWSEGEEPFANVEEEE